MNLDLQVDAGVAEGARTGLEYATFGWWACVVSGLCYGAYLLAVDFSVRNKLVVFADPNCQYCKRYEAELKALPDVTITLAPAALAICSSRSSVWSLRTRSSALL